MPAFWQACLTMAWTFCRGALVEVWKRNLILRPAFSRTPPAPVPAAWSRTALALSMLNSHRVFGERNWRGFST